LPGLINMCHRRNAINQPFTDLQALHTILNREGSKGFAQFILFACRLPVLVTSSTV
jgi:hypothetical protein